MAVPVPESATALSPLAASVTTDREPLFAPALVGANVTLIAQVSPGARDAPQSFDWLNCPLALMLLTAIATPPVLARVTVFAVLTSPFCTLPKARESGVRLDTASSLTSSITALPTLITMVAAVPESGTDAGPAAFETSTMEPVRVPTTDGTNFSARSTNAFGASSVGSVSLTSSKSPVAVMLLIAMSSLPVFVRRTVRVTDSSPTDVAVNTRLAGRNFATAVTAIPVPARVASATGPSPKSADSNPVLAPVSDGLNVMATVNDLPGLMVNSGSAVNVKSPLVVSACKKRFSSPVFFSVIEVVPLSPR